MPHHQYWLPALFMVLSYALDLGLFLLPGFAFAVTLSARRTVAPLYLVILIVTAGALLGYVSFWCFFANKIFGKLFTLVIYTAALALTSRSLIRSPRSRMAATQIATPFLFVLLAGVCYLSWLYLFGVFENSGPGIAGFRFFTEVRPGDNIIPLFLAERIYGHKPLQPFCCIDWLSSDRPPLQAGIVLLLRPLRLLSSPLVEYLRVSTALQCLWAAGAWCALTALGTSKPRIRQVLVYLILSGFLFFNSVYVWPKLLAATLLLFVLSILFQALRSRRTITALEAVLAAASLGLALLAHSGSVFSLSAFLLVFIRRPKILRVRHALLATGVLALLLLPWTAYQKFVDPPGNRLLKMHLAGVLQIDGRSVSQALLDSYREHPFSQILKNKLSNIENLLGSKPFDISGLTAVRLQPKIHLDRSQSEDSRIAQREYIWNAVGVLNLGWIPLFVSLFARGKLAPAVPYSGWLITASIANFLAWSLILFGPHGTFTTHSSYADILLLDMGLAGWVLSLPFMAATAVLCLQVFDFLAIWVWSGPATSFGAAPVQPGFLAVGLLCVCILVWIFIQSSSGEWAEPILFSDRPRVPWPSSAFKWLGNHTHLGSSVRRKQLLLTDYCEKFDAIIVLAVRTLFNPAFIAGSCSAPILRKLHTGCNRYPTQTSQR